MSKHVIHQHSSVADKRPSASSLEYGEIAVNYASGKEAIMLRNTEDAVVTISSDVQNDSKFALKNEVNDFSSQITVIENDMTEISAKTGYLLSAVTETWFDENQDAIPDAFHSLSLNVGSFDGRLKTLEEYDHVGEVYPGSTSGEVFNDYETNIASGNYSHAEGGRTTATGDYSHAEGFGTSATSTHAHAEGNRTIANGGYSHAEGYHTITNNFCEHAAGRFNKSDQSNTTSRQTRFSIGIGTNDTDRKNAIEAKANGDVYIYGVGGFDGQNDADADVLPIGDAIPSIVVTSAVPSTLASNTIYFIY